MWVHFSLLAGGRLDELVLIIFTSRMEIVFPLKEAFGNNLMHDDEHSFSSGDFVEFMFPRPLTVHQMSNYCSKVTRMFTEVGDGIY